MQSVPEAQVWTTGYTHSNPLWSSCRNHRGLLWILTAYSHTRFTSLKSLSTIPQQVHLCAAKKKKEKRQLWLIPTGRGSHVACENPPSLNPLPSSVGDHQQRRQNGQCPEERLLRGPSSDVYGYQIGAWEPSSRPAIWYPGCTCFIPQSLPTTVWSILVPKHAGTENSPRNRFNPSGHYTNEAAIDLPCPSIISIYSTGFDTDQVY